MFKKKYHKFRFDVYDLAMEYSRFLSIFLKQLRNSKDDDLQDEIYSYLYNFIDGVPRKNKYNKEKLKECFLSHFHKPVEKDIEKLFDTVATFCYDCSKYNTVDILNILGEINGFKW